MCAVSRVGLAASFAVLLALQSGCRVVRERRIVGNTAAQNVAIEALRKAYAAFNRNDISATVEALDPQVEWTEPAEFPGGGTYYGHDGVKAYLTQSRAAWAEVNSEPERFIAGGDKIVVFVHARVRPKGSNAWQEARLADVYTFRDGKAIQMRAFADRDQALEWARTTEKEIP